MVESERERARNLLTFCFSVSSIDDKAAKKLIKELKQGIERAKTDMNYGVDEDFLAAREL